MSLHTAVSRVESLAISIERGYNHKGDYSVLFDRVILTVTETDGTRHVMSLHNSGGGKVPIYLVRGNDGEFEELYLDVEESQ